MLTFVNPRPHVTKDSWSLFLPWSGLTSNTSSPISRSHRYRQVRCSKQKAPSMLLSLHITLANAASLKYSTRSVCCKAYAATCSTRNTHVNPPSLTWKNLARSRPEEDHDHPITQSDLGKEAHVPFSWLDLFDRSPRLLSIDQRLFEAESFRGKIWRRSKRSCRGDDRSRAGNTAENRRTANPRRSEFPPGGCT